MIEYSHIHTLHEPIIDPTMRLAKMALSSAFSPKNPIIKATATGGATKEDTDS